MAASELHGARELSIALGKMGKKLGASALRSAAGKAVTPVIRQMRQRAPVGKSSHRIYTGEIKAPGFLRKSITRSSRFDRRTGSAVVRIGVRPAAFYGIKFIDQGPHTITQRRKKAIKPYTLRRNGWLTDTFLANIGAMEKDLLSELRKRIKGS